LPIFSYRPFSVPFRPEIIYVFICIVAGGQQTKPGDNARWDQSSFYPQNTASNGAHGIGAGWGGGATGTAGAGLDDGFDQLIASRSKSPPATSQDIAMTFDPLAGIVE